MKINKQFKVLLADDHKIVRHGLKKILEDEFSEVTVGEASRDTEILEQLNKSDWDIVILDINMPGKSGLEILKDIKATHPKLPVLILSMYPEEQFALRVMKSGASGYLRKDSAPEELVDAVKEILEGRKYISPNVMDILSDVVKKDRSIELSELLSDREYEIFMLIAQGKTVSEIAEILSLSVKTVSTHRTHILEKTRLKNNADIVMYAVRNKLLQ
ncbi:Response regulator [Ignavibacterium album JCM 16511]|uniref:Response regulator n=1 Tax=Ignavibacterium album (strain DSM 19864 / JCM 16511 / NBRC 101810 / Mat9-16) TaxID=945713 RepID=I0AMJ1_IGNAJ|nr:response regulator transcription factor [Ignavibacterium album]AFH50198.1 Response regulator [Ignavibacterium album JCM 16511]